MAPAMFQGLLPLFSEQLRASDADDAPCTAVLCPLIDLGLLLTAH